MTGTIFSLFDTARQPASKKGSSRGPFFLYGLSVKMALVIEKPNEKSKGKHRQNKPNLYRVEIS
jgi:hypothetical protein